MSIVFDKLKQMVGQLATYHTSKGWFHFIFLGLRLLFGSVYDFKIKSNLYFNSAPASS